MIVAIGSAGQVDTDDGVRQYLPAGDLGRDISIGILIVKLKETIGAVGVILPVILHKVP